MTLDDLKTFHRKLGECLAPYEDRELVPEHPVHGLRALHSKVARQIAELDAEAEADAEGEVDTEKEFGSWDDDKGTWEQHGGEGSGTYSHPTGSQYQNAAWRRGKPGHLVGAADPGNEALHPDTQKRLRVTHERVLEAHARLIAERDGVPLAKARVMAADRDPQSTIMLMDTRDPSPDESPTQRAAWREIEAEADALESKSNRPLSREQAIDRTMRARPDLVRKYYGEPYADPSQRR